MMLKSIIRREVFYMDQPVEKDIDLVQVEQKARRNCFVQNVPPERFGG